MHNTDRIQKQIIDRLQQQGIATNNIRMFYNSKTLRLTRTGLSLLIKYEKSFKVDLPTQFTSKELITLMRTVNTPYYIGKKRLILFSEEDAFMARLAGAKGWIQSK